jgi:hypothetical protein
MNTLPLHVHTPRAVQSPKACLELDMPLHAYTDSDTHVAQLVGTLLNGTAGVDQEVSHADILQALAITTAVRVAMADAAAKSGAALPLELLDVNVGSAHEAAPRVA